MDCQKFCGICGVNHFSDFLGVGEEGNDMRPMPAPHGRDRRESLAPGSLFEILQPLYRRAAHVSGHSTRVGATQDLAELDIDLAAITLAGGWESTRMPLHYAEKINAGGWGMARA